METAKALQGDDTSTTQGTDAFAQSPVAFFQKGTVTGQEGKAWPAILTGYRLGVEPAIFRIVEFRPAFFAKGETGHGCIGSIVGEALDYGEPGAAVGTVREGVAKSPVPWFVHFSKAVSAGGNIRGKQGIPILRTLAFQNFEDPWAGLGGQLVEVDRD
jgi:hypothetical protein